MYNRNHRLVLPLFGTGPKKYEQLRSQATITFKERTFQKMVATPGKIVDSWEVGTEPAIVASLPDGSALAALTFDQCCPTSAAPLVSATQLPERPLDNGLPGASLESVGGNRMGMTGSLEVRS